MAAPREQSIYRYFWLRIIRREDLVSSGREILEDARSWTLSSAPQTQKIVPFEDGQVMAMASGGSGTVSVKVNLQYDVSAADAFGLAVDRSVLMSEENARKWISDPEGGLAFARGGLCVLCTVAVEGH